MYYCEGSQAAVFRVASCCSMPWSLKNIITYGTQLHAVSTLFGIGLSRGEWGPVGSLFVSLARVVQQEAEILNNGKL